MKVFTLIKLLDREQPWVLGVYATRELAVKGIYDHLQEWESDDDYAGPLDEQAIMEWVAKSYDADFKIQEAPFTAA